jgi:hypothetical protein
MEAADSPEKWYTTGRLFGTISKKIDTEIHLNLYILVCSNSNNSTLPIWKGKTFQLTLIINLLSTHIPVLTGM